MLLKGLPIFYWFYYIHRVDFNTKHTLKCTIIYSFSNKNYPKPFFLLFCVTFNCFFFQFLVQQVARKQNHYTRKSLRLFVSEHFRMETEITMQELQFLILHRYINNFIYYYLKLTYIIIIYICIIDQACSVKMAGYILAKLIFAFLWTETKSRSIKMQKRTRPISSHLD